MNFDGCDSTGRIVRRPSPRGCEPSCVTFVSIGIARNSGDTECFNRSPNYPVSTSPSSKVLHDYEARLIEGPILILPAMEKFDFSYDPNQVIPLDESRAIYPTLRVTDVWGVLEVSDGAMVVREDAKFARAVVQAPKASAGSSGVIEGQGWKLTLAAGWRLAEGSRKGDRVVSKSE